ncbi:MAG: dihydroorotate dehydrogenase electron transfer subunit [Lachnospiraceae bacterium]|nr:dihydroorotate dehydrogenase electron transfer subunit [Lachnospiraceae bacterium]
MDKKIKEQGIITATEQITSDIYGMWVKTAQIAQNAKPGQFAAIYCKEGSRLLPRPISICEIDKEAGILRFVYRVVGKGTDEFSKLTAGDKIELMGPLGNGFPLESENVILMGGGIGIPPMLEVAKQMKGKVSVVLGYRDAENFLKSEFEPYADVYVATEDGSVGTKGNVIDAIKANSLNADTIMACGPVPMLRGIKQYATENGIDAWLSMEERMACGIGACLACVCKSKEKDSHTNVQNKRVCKDGPVFHMSEIDLD